MGNGGGGGEPSVIKGGGGGGGAVLRWARGRGPRPRGEMTGWGGQHHRPPLRPRGRAERCGGFAGFVAYSRGARRTGAAVREGSQEGRGDVMARAPPPPQPRGVAVCRVGTGWVVGWVASGGRAAGAFSLGSARPRPDFSPLSEISSRRLFGPRDGGAATPMDPVSRSSA
uniref:Uncharacterized protein n=1 Tax=Setaria viridis TaxID=4556 RepID=A0A4U6T4F7_SETVI|nr:hypothetical protein SEVIR_9G324232v2 [Setaria viridis]